MTCWQLGSSHAPSFGEPLAEGDALQAAQEQPRPELRLCSSRMKMTRRPLGSSHARSFCEHLSEPKILDLHMLHLSVPGFRFLFKAERGWVKFGPFGKHFGRIFGFVECVFRVGMCASRGVSARVVVCLVALLCGWGCAGTSGCFPTSGVDICLARPAPNMFF